jgi:tricorn protease
VETKRDTKVVTSGFQDDRFTDLAWSPNSELLAVSYRGSDDARPRVLLYGIDGRNQVIVTSDKYQSGEPVFSRDGKWLYYLSNRHFEARNTVWADRDFGPSFDNQTEVFAHALTEDAEFPFQVSTELTPAKPESEEDDEESEDLAVDVDWGGIVDRIWQVPVPAGNYGDLAVTEEFLYLLTSPADGSQIMAMPIEPEPEAAPFTEGVAAMGLSDDGSKMLVVKQADETVEMFIVPAEKEFPEDTSDSVVRMDGWQFSVDPRVEWTQLFHDAWLMHREQFYDPDMRGVDWPAVKEKYALLLERVTDRYELNDVLGQMTGELNALHSAVRGGDVPSDPGAPEPSVLGAKLVQTGSGVEIERIYYHDSEVPSEAPPLGKPGVDAANGDVIVAVNGSEMGTLESVHRALRNQAGKQVLLKLRRGRDEIQTVVVPAKLDDDYNFRYKDWVQSNRLKVDATDSDIGYLHIQNMVTSDVAAFAREFYAHEDKKGIVIDVRRNGGGNVDSWIIDRLMRKAWMFWAYRTDEPYFNLQNAFRGHLAVIADEGTYSDGETFVAAIKALDVAPVIGVRTAGAGVWLSGQNRLSDFGIARVAEFPAFAMDGRWIVEGYGVTPTMEVENLPHATYRGDDTQLNAAIEYLQRKIEEEPIPEAIPQPFPQIGETAEDILN